MKTRRTRASERHQETAAILSRAIERRGLSLRNLAARCGLKNHMALSRFLAGKGGLSLDTLFRVVSHLEITGADLHAIVNCEFPPSMRPYFVPPLEAGAHPRAMDVTVVRVQPKAHMPTVAETLRLLGTSTAKELAKALNPSLELTLAQIDEALIELERMDFVCRDGERWRLRHPELHVNNDGRRAESPVALRHREEQVVLHNKLLARNEALATGTVVLTLPAKNADDARVLLRHIYRGLFDQLALLDSGDNTQLFSVMFNAIHLASRSKSASPARR